MIYIPNRRKSFRAPLDYKAFYQFEGNGNDQTGNNNATMSNVTYSSTGGKPGLGQYAIFNGTTSYGQVTDAADVTDIKTCCGWVYINGWGENNAGRIIDKGPNLTIFYVDSSQRLVFQKHFDTTAGTWSTDNSSLSTGSWIHVGYTYAMDDNTATDPILYINGNSVNVNEDNTPEGSMVSDTGDDLYIGNRDTNDRTFDGRKDNLRAYSRSIFPTEMRAIYLSEGGT